MQTVLLATSPLWATIHSFQCKYVGAAPRGSEGPGSATGAHQHQRTSCNQSQAQCGVMCAIAGTHTHTHTHTHTTCLCGCAHLRPPLVISPPHSLSSLYYCCLSTVAPIRVPPFPQAPGILWPATLPSPGVTFASGPAAAAGHRHIRGWQVRCRATFPPVPPQAPGSRPQATVPAPPGPSAQHHIWLVVYMHAWRPPVGRACLPGTTD